VLLAISAAYAADEELPPGERRHRNRILARDGIIDRAQACETIASSKSLENFAR
jgi:hypothetical protein